MRQRRWLELLKDYDANIQYHPGKANVVADAFSRKSYGSMSCLITQPKIVADLNRLKEAQKDDGELWAIMQNLEDGKQDEFRLDDHEVLWCGDRLCVPNNTKIQKALLSEAHSSPVSIHPGSTKMYQDLKQNFWWSGMKKDVAEFVAKCLTCQQVKIEHQRASGLLQQLEIPVWKWEKITMDLVTGLPRTLRKNDAIWVVVDRLTKSAHFLPIREGYSASKLAEIFQKEIIRLHGTPVSIVSDRDPRFTSQFWKGFQRAWGTKLNYSTAFHPQTDGQSERTIQTLEDMLRCCALEWTGNWDDYLCLVEFAYNNSWHASIGMAPYEMLYGRKCRYPICWNEKSFADKHRRTLDFEPSDHVFLMVSPWKGVHRLGIKGKLSPRFIGPFEVLERVGEVAYRLALPLALSHMHNVFHVSTLRGYNYHPLHVVEYPLDKIQEDLYFEEEAEVILAREERIMHRKTIPFVKVLWKNHSKREATWELEESIRSVGDNKSSPFTKDDNDPSFDDGHRVYEANSSIPPKKQCLGNYPLVVATPTQLVSNSNNCARGKRNRTNHNRPLTGDTSTQQLSSSNPPLSNNHTRGRRSRTNHNRPATADNSSQEPSSSDYPLEYKYLGSCTHSCQHCGALFWFQERLKIIPIGLRPRYNRCCRADRVALHNEVDNRLSHYGGDNSVLRRDIVEGLIELLDTHNALVQLFRTTREKFQDNHVPNFKLRLYNVVVVKDYELPTGDMLGVIVYETGLESDMDYDIVLEQRSGLPKRVNKLHPSDMSLQFPLLFIYGEDGYSKDLKMIGSSNSLSEDKRLTMLAYYSYYLHDHANRYNYLSRTGKLFQQYVVTAFCAIEQNRIDYIREHQHNIRNEYLSGIYDAISRGDNDGFNCGSKLILPQSFTGGLRYMYSHYLDALAICRVHGNPSYFITFTCNVKWPEISDYMTQFPLLTTTDRADVVARVFEMKIHEFVNYLRDVQPFEKVVAVLSTIEFQKRGLPHCHTLLWIDEFVQVRRDKNIDTYVSAELPSQDVDPQGYRIVSELMMHDPCGIANPSATCTQNSTRCKNDFPKEYCNQTYIDKSGFVHYKRRDTGVTTTRQNVSLDNRYVVPYNKQLLLAFYAHINVAYCGWTMLIKYLLKYISKGTDRVVACISKSNSPSVNNDTGASTSRPQVVIDEIKNYLDARYVSPHEACWRIFEFEIHYREPTIQLLAVHLQNMQQVVFREGDHLNSVVLNSHKKKTTLTEWLYYNEQNDEGRHLTYLNFTSEYVWYPNGKYWRRRQRRNKSSIGRLAYVHPAAGDLFDQRMLLRHKKGCTSFPGISTINTIVYPICRAACEALGLLQDDREWEITLQEAALTTTPAELRALLAHIFAYCEVSDPKKLWERTWKIMSEDIPYVSSISLNLPGLHIDDPDLKDYMLYEFEACMNHCSKFVTYFGLRLPPEHLMSVLRNRLLMEEKSYDRQELAAERDNLLPRLNENQRQIFNLIINACFNNQQQLVFVYGHGGTGKTLLWKTILYTLRCERKIVLAVASSGIASLLLPAGRTAHSHFKIQLDLTDTRVCAIKKIHNSLTS
ncbi:DNA helicase [Tanacetum coccineum]